MAIVGTEEPQVAVVVHFLNTHRTRCGRAIGGDASAKEAGLSFIDQFLHFLDCFHAAEVGTIVFGLLLIDGIHMVANTSSLPPTLVAVNLLKAAAESCAGFHLCCDFNTALPRASSDPLV